MKTKSGILDELSEESTRKGNPAPWWVWAIISILIGEAAWFANTTITMQATVAALSAKVDAIGDNVNRLMDNWGRPHE